MHLPPLLKTHFLRLIKNVCDAIVSVQPLGFRPYVAECNYVLTLVHRQGYILFRGDNRVTERPIGQCDNGILTNLKIGDGNGAVSRCSNDELNIPYVARAALDLVNKYLDRKSVV